MVRTNSFLTLWLGVSIQQTSLQVCWVHHVRQVFLSQEFSSESGLTLVLFAHILRLVLLMRAGDWFPPVCALLQRRLCRPRPLLAGGSLHYKSLREHQ